MTVTVIEVDGFNPRTRVGCDAVSVPVNLTAAGVSIHAPAWGATQDLEEELPISLVSIHAPAWGATEVEQWQRLHRYRFQSTHPRGVRHANRHHITHATGVSIHAPAWGATLSGGSSPRRTSRFNPRTRVGCDPGWMQSNGARLVSIHAPAWGATAAVLPTFAAVEVSIHAPAWGAT